MNRMLVVVTLLFPATAIAERLDAAEREPANTAEIRVGYDQAFVAQLGYSRTTSLLGHAVVLDGEVTLPWDTPDVDDFRVRVGAAVPLLDSGRWSLRARVAPTVRGNDNATARLLGVGADLSVLGGYRASSWFIGAEAGLDAELATYIIPSDAYRMRVYDGAREGWYSATEGTLRYGLHAGATLGRGELSLRVGQMYTTDLTPTLLPLFATAGYGRRW